MEIGIYIDNKEEIEIEIKMEIEIQWRIEMKIEVINQLFVMAAPKTSCSAMVDIFKNLLWWGDQQLKK